MESRRAGVVGLGLMASAMSERLLRAGYALRVWNRTPEKARPLLALGAEWSDNPLGGGRRTPPRGTSMTDRWPSFLCWAVVACCLPGRAAAGDFSVLKPDAFAHHIDSFNAADDEKEKNFVPNADAWPWLCANIPLFECPDRQVEEIYYFRWWSLRKHLRRQPQRFVFTEFITRPEPISSALGHHLLEGRWLRDQRY
jgi:hypothetical protein